MAGLRSRVFVPLARLSLRPVMIESQTTAERMTMRLRLAGDDQLASGTPRPQAPADSLASVQFHESAINNFLERLELDGRTFTLPELVQHVAEKLNRRPAPVDPEHADMRITFADQDCARRALPRRPAFPDRQPVLPGKAADTWEDFQIRVFYRPEVSGRSAELVRDGVVQLSSSGLNCTGQIAVRTICAKLFSKNTAWQLVPERFINNPRLADLMVTQLEIEDGWLGLAFRACREPSVARR